MEYSKGTANGKVYECLYLKNRSQINSLIMHLKFLEEQEQGKAKLLNEKKYKN
jgi:hypothetical protein